MSIPKSVMQNMMKDGAKVDTDVVVFLFCFLL